MESTTERDPRDAVSTPGLLWPAQAEASEDLVAEGSAAAVVFMEAAADFTAEEVAVAFMEVVGEVTVGDG